MITFKKQKYIELGFMCHMRLSFAFAAQWRKVVVRARGAQLYAVSLLGLPCPCRINPERQQLALLLRKAPARSQLLPVLCPVPSPNQ
jgi:hypothetical protein